MTKNAVRSSFECGIISAPAEHDTFSLCLFASSEKQRYPIQLKYDWNFDAKNIYILLQSTSQLFDRNDCWQSI